MQTQKYINKFLHFTPEYRNAAHLQNTANSKINQKFGESSEHWKILLVIGSRLR